MKKHRTCQYMLIATVLFLVAVAASCSVFPPMPDHVGLGAVRYAAKGVLNAL